MFTTPNNDHTLLEGKDHTLYPHRWHAPQIFIILWFFEHISCPSSHSSRISKSYLKTPSRSGHLLPLVPHFKGFTSFPLHLSTNPLSLPCLQGSKWSICLIFGGKEKVLNVLSNTYWYPKWCLPKGFSSVVLMAFNFVLHTVCGT